MHNAEYDASEPELHQPLVDLLGSRRREVVELDSVGLRGVRTVHAMYETGKRKERTHASWSSERYPK